MDRRTFIASGAALVAALGADRTLAQSPAAAGDAQLNTLFDRILADTIAHSPQLATSLGFDKGDGAALKSRLDDASEAETRAALDRTKSWIARLKAVPTAGLSPAAALNRDIILYSLEQRALPADKFGIDSVIRPYRIFQQGGAYFSVPDFLNDTHVIETREDAEAYLARLAAFAKVLDQDSMVQRAQAARGFVAPDFSIDLTVGQMKRLRATPAADSNLVGSLVRRAAAKSIPGAWASQASAIVESAVYPALDRQIALMTELRGKTLPGAGLWRLPAGDAIYAAALAQATTTTLTPDEVHQMGLDQVAAISAQLDAILTAEGLTQGSVGARLTALNKDPKQLYPATPEGRAALIASLNDGVRAMYQKLPQAFTHVPSAPLEIRAVPVEIQDGASNGYYKRAALDGSRPAIYFINLKDVGDWPKYGLPSLTYHEGVPGHHLQISLAQESADIPTLRKIGGFSAYSEGWALYAEQLADELHAYATPLERAGYLQSFLFRAARLVVDTGIHTRQWTREKATAYLVDTTGFAAPRSQREVERYCTQAGQACSYKVGHMAWTRAREKAQKQLGTRFDLKRFHDILGAGAMPLTLLETLIDQRTNAAV